MEQNQNREEIETSLDHAVRDHTKYIFKTASFAALPVAVLGGAGILGALVSSCFENRDLGTLVSGGISLGVGVVIGYSGMITDYIETLRNLVDDFRHASRKVREYSTRLEELK